MVWIVPLSSHSTTSILSICRTSQFRRSNGSASGGIPKRRVTLLYGPDNTGKTPLAQQLQTATALRSEWLGMKVERVRSFGLYCEDDVSDIHARQAAINQYYQCEMLDLELMRAAARLEANSNALIDFSNSDEGKLTALYIQLECFCADEGIQLVILDPLAELFIGYQNNPTHARCTIRALNRLAVAIDGYVILTGHPSRAGQKSDGSGESGSVQWSATGRSRLYLKRPEQQQGSTEPVDPYLRRLERRKATYASIGDFIDLRWDNGVFVPLSPPTGIIRTIERQNAKRILIDFVAKTASENQWVSLNSNAGNYTPDC